MQGRMKQHQLTKEEISEVLSRASVGRIATISESGFPYVVPVHFICRDGRIYIHGLIKGEKISNLIRNSKVGFEVDEMGAIILDEKMVCDTNTEFRSVIILGTAEMIDHEELKTEVLKAVVKKYTPELSHMEFPANIFKATGVIEITIVECTGKYYK